MHFYISFKKLCCFCCCCCCWWWWWWWCFATKGLFWIPLDLPEGVYFTPFLIVDLRHYLYDLVFRKYRVRESGSTRKQPGVDCKLCVVTPCVLAGDDHYRLCLLNMGAVCFFQKLLPTYQTAPCRRDDGSNMKLYDSIKQVPYSTMFCSGWVVLDENNL